VRAALAPPCTPGPPELQREADTLADVLASGLVPEDRIAAAVGAVLEPRHSRESSELITEQYSERAAALSEALKQLLEDKAEARRAALVQLKGSNSKEWQCAAALAKVETDFAARRQVSDTVTAAATALQQLLLLKLLVILLPVFLLLLL
jgi:hypothetical protein